MPASSSSTMPKVLVIDDEAGIRTLLVMRFRHQDMVGSLHARLDGVELYRRERPILVLDLNMPEPDGVTALKEIRSVDLNALSWF